MEVISKLYIFALAANGAGISGGDRISIELARRWSKKFSITIYLDEEGFEMCRRQNLPSGKNLKFEIVKLGILGRLGFVGNYIARIIAGIRMGLFLKLPTTDHRPLTTFLYSASEFWMDSFPCVILKLRYPKIKWVATWYQTAPNPLKGFAEGKRESSYHLKAFQYWLAQLPVMPLTKKLADKVIVNNEDEKKRYPEHTQKGNTIVLIGAVPLVDIKSWLKKNQKVKKTYDGVFQGRFHPQKGVLELVDIWKLVVAKKPNAKLGMIGDGPLMNDVRNKIQDLRLEKNIKLFGYVFDGDVKYNLFASGKVVVHPAFYDSGGMASAEAMAFGLPCVGFNLKAYESYYPKGMVKVPIGDKQKFADEVIRLLNDKKYYKVVAKDALDMIIASWSWEVRSEQIYKEIIRA